MAIRLSLPLYIVATKGVARATVLSITIQERPILYGCESWNGLQSAPVGIRGRLGETMRAVPPSSVRNIPTWP